MKIALYSFAALLFTNSDALGAIKCPSGTEHVSISRFETEHYGDIGFLPQIGKESDVRNAFHVCVIKHGTDTIKINGNITSKKAVFIIGNRNPNLEEDFSAIFYADIKYEQINVASNIRPVVSRNKDLKFNNSKLWEDVACDSHIFHPDDDYEIDNENIKEAARANGDILVASVGNILYNYDPIERTCGVNKKIGSNWHAKLREVSKSKLKSKNFYIYSVNRSSFFIFFNSLVNDEKK